MLGPGTQVLYCPAESDGDETHESCREGFVTSRHANGMFNVRFWKDDTNKIFNILLPIQVKECYLLAKDTRPQELVSEWMMELFGIELPFIASAERHKRTTVDTAVKELIDQRTERDQENWSDTEI